MKSESACFVLGCEGLFPFPVSLKPLLGVRGRRREQVHKENCCPWGSEKMKAGNEAFSHAAGSEGLERSKARGATHSLYFKIYLSLVGRVA